MNITTLAEQAEIIRNEMRTDTEVLAKLGSASGLVIEGVGCFWLRGTTLVGWLGNDLDPDMQRLIEIEVS